MSVAISTLLKLPPSASAPASVVFLDATVATLGTAMPQFRRTAANNWLFSCSAPDGTVVVKVLDAGGNDMDSFAVAIPTPAGLTDSQATALAAIKARTDTIVAGRVTVRTPVTEHGTHLILVRGDDYNLTTADPLDFVDANGNWPDMTNGTVILTCRDANDVVILSVAGIIVVGTGMNKMVRFQPSHTMTKQLPVGNRIMAFDVRATVAGQVKTLIQGQVTVLPDQSRSCEN